MVCLANELVASIVISCCYQCTCHYYSLGFGSDYDYDSAHLNHCHEYYCCHSSYHYDYHYHHDHFDCSSGYGHASAHDYGSDSDDCGHYCLLLCFLLLDVLVIVVHAAWCVIARSCLYLFV